MKKTYFYGSLSQKQELESLLNTKIESVSFQLDEDTLILDASGFFLLTEYFVVEDERFFTVDEVLCEIRRQAICFDCEKSSCVDCGLSLSPKF